MTPEYYKPLLHNPLPPTGIGWTQPDPLMPSATGPLDFVHIVNMNSHDKESAVIFDIDNTLATMPDWRGAMLDKDEIDWLDYNKKGIYDAPNMPVVELINFYRMRDNKVILVTGRDYDSAPETQMWLHKHDIYWDMLLMRPVGCYLPNQELKKKYVDVLQSSFEIVAVYKDNLKCRNV